MRRLLGHGEGGVQVFTRGGDSSDDSRVSTPTQEHQDVWLALYVEHENERGQLLRQLRRSREPGCSRMPRSSFSTTWNALRSRNWTICCIGEMRYVDR